MAVDVSIARAKKTIAKMVLALVGRVGELAALDCEDPVFIVGTGRCGTDLLVTVLNSHPQIVRFPGEANGLWHPMLYPINNPRIDTAPIEVDPQMFTESSIANWPPGHPERIQRVFKGFHLVVGRKRTLLVKSAMISFMIPKIIDMFPKARFIHLYRYGPSVVESYFKKNFGKYSSFACTETEYYRLCARYWSRCILEIERCRTSLALDANGAFLELSYERLCDDPKMQLERIADFIGVDSCKFKFDLSTIQNTNYKVAEKNDRWWVLVHDEMCPTMRLKGYLQ